MKTLHLTGLALAIATGFALPLAGSAEAAMGGALPSTQILPVENAQFFFLGHNFCWYDGGWQGPGWYWCGYAWNNGYGWGGGDGWHGWNRAARIAARMTCRRAALSAMRRRLYVVRCAPTSMARRRTVRGAAPTSAAMARAESWRRRHVWQNKK